MTKHVSVLLQEAVEAIKPKEGGVYVDCTLGGGGHTLAILAKLGKSGELISFDQDLNAIKAFESTLPEYDFLGSKGNFAKGELRLVLVNSNFSEIKVKLTELRCAKVDGILADLGLSTDQIESERGFSFLGSAELDMRMDQTKTVKALDLVNGLYTKELEELFKKYADAPFAGTLAKAIVKHRASNPITTADQLKAVILEVVPVHFRKGRFKNPDARIFQALRIIVNDEINSLKVLLRDGFELLNPGGRLAIISFHSGEDKVVKEFGVKEAQSGKAEFDDNPILPSIDEIESNPKSSSAKLRIIRKI